MKQWDAKLNGMLPVIMRKNNGRDEIVWLECSLEEFTAPFFFITMNKLFKSNTRRTINTGVETLLEFSTENNEGKIKGMIFHVSRCGSTALSTSLAKGFDCIVLSEPAILYSFLSPFANSESKGKNQYSHETNIKLQKGLLNALLRYINTPIVVKNNCVCLLDYNKLLSSMPAPKSLFLFRDPVEVLASNFVTPAGWMEFFRKPHISSQFFEDTELDDLSLATIGMSALLSGGEELVKGNNTACIDYERLNAEMVCKIGEYFELEKRYGIEQLLAHAMQFYSKDPDNNLPFVPDREDKYKLLGKDVIDFIKNNTYSLFNSLKEAQNI